MCLLPIYVLFGEVFAQIFCLFLKIGFVFLWLSYEIFLYVLGSSPLPNMLIVMKSSLSNFLIFLIIFIAAYKSSQRVA